MAKKTARKTARKTASKKTVNKSQAIRDYVAKNKVAGPTEIAAALKKKGINVTPAFVSNVKSKPAKKTRGKKVRLRASKKAAQSTALQDVKHAGGLVVKAVELVLAAGAKEAENLVSTAADIVKRIRE